MRIVAGYVDCGLATVEPTAWRLGIAGAGYDLRRAGLENDLEQLGGIEALPFEHVQAPTLVLHGTEDADVPIADAELAAASIAGSRLSSIEGGWHVLPLSLQSAEADRERASFLSDL